MLDVHVVCFEIINNMPDFSDIKKVGQLYQKYNKVSTNM